MKLADLLALAEKSQDRASPRARRCISVVNMGPAVEKPPSGPIVRSALGKEDVECLVESLRLQLEDLGLDKESGLDEVYYNLPVAELVEHSLKHEEGARLTSRGALTVLTGAKTGKSSQDRRIVEEPDSMRNVWWADMASGSVSGGGSLRLEEEDFDVNRDRAISFLNSQSRIFVVDGFAGFGEEYRIPVRVVTTRASHALIATHLLVPPTDEELAVFEVNAYPRPFTIFDAGAFPCNRYKSGVTSSTLVAMALARGEMVILGTEYAGEMKEGIFTAILYHMPRRPEPWYSPVQRALPLHAACSVDLMGAHAALFLGQSGSGKTLLGTEQKRQLLNDDGVIWTSEGLLGIENGCQAKCTHLTHSDSPVTSNAARRFGSVVENVTHDDFYRSMEFGDTQITENVRCTYPLTHVPKSIRPCETELHPSDIFMLVRDTFGILPPIAKLTATQAIYHFISGFTGVMAGGKARGEVLPMARFSPCFASSTLPMTPDVYTELFTAKLAEHEPQCWLLNTGWIGGDVGSGRAISLAETQELVSAVLDGTLQALPDDAWIDTEVFRLRIPSVAVGGLSPEILCPRRAWAAAGKSSRYDDEVKMLATLFQKNFDRFSGAWAASVIGGGPTLPQPAA